MSDNSIPEIAEDAEDATVLEVFDIDGDGVVRVRTGRCRRRWFR